MSFPFNIAIVLMSATCMHAAPFIVAHRGASHDAPENTLPAFELAWKQGANAIEGDFHLTSDGRLICIHDADTKRVTGVAKKIAKTTFDELRRLDAGAWFKPEWKGTRLPSFGEVAATVPAGGRFYVEIKAGAAAVPVLVREIRDSALKPAQVVVISFDAAVIKAFKSREPNIKAFWLASFKDASPLDPSVQRVLATLRDTGADGFSSKADPRMEAGFTDALRKAGFQYHCWTVDDPLVAKKFLALGAASITTNRPGFLRENLQ